MSDNNLYHKEFIKKLTKEKENWDNAFNNINERKKEFKTPSGIVLKRLYTPLDVKEDYFEEIGFPGQPPYTRGVYPNMYRGRIWTMRQYGGFADAIKTNERFKYLISQGQKGLSIA
ncbi:MAG: methylmalonyl-CoA mutase, partial [Candidatus Lokiarchaeota archaeon]|nr:methylmalonyl-CoA mutase [Candidatus Lokiarchaeota archaeon]